MWFGWSGHAGDPEQPLERWTEADVEYATLDLTDAEIEHYYEGFCNRVLWPLLHGMPDRAHLDRTEYEVWREVNRRFASRLCELLRPDDLVWIHDYQLIPLGEELRARGWRGALGYFHHIPIPGAAGWALLPHHAEIASAFRAYDLVALQTERDRVRLSSYVGEPAARFAALPISIDPDEVRASAAQCPDDPFAVMRQGRQVVFGLDRLDYTKDVPGRFNAFAALLEADSTLAQAAMLVQWSAPSREGIPEYQDERRLVDAAAERARRVAPDAVDLRVEVLPPATVAAALRDADVCLVTSIADGMNLVAKEFVAVQPPRTPGVLVLTDGCGAAEELTEALIVPSGDALALGKAIRMALAMPLPERVERWRALLATVEANTASVWAQRFLELLEERARGTSQAL